VQATAAVVPGLRHNRNYHWLWLGQTISLLGDEVFDTTIVLWIGIRVAGGEAWAPLAVAGALVAGTAPVVLFSLIGGVYADRWDRRRTMLATDAVRCVLIGALVALPFAGPAVSRGLLLTIAYLVLAMSSTATQFFNPARFGLLATVVADVDRERMSSMAAGTAALTGIVGPSLAAGLLATVAVQWVLLLNAVSFAISFVVVAMVRPGPDAAAPTTTAAPLRMRQELMVGIRFVAASPLLRIMLITTVVVMAGTSAISALDVFFVTRNLHAPAEIYGVLATASGLGALAGAALTAIWSKRVRATRVYSYGLVLIGALMVCYSQLTSPLGAIAILFLTGVPTAAVNSMIGPLVLRSAPVHLLGRVSTVLAPATRLASLLSVALVAWLASTVLRDLDATVAGVHFGTIDTILLGAGLVIVASGAWAVHALRRTEGRSGAPGPDVAAAE
jgi:MFS family permease